MIFSSCYQVSTVGSFECIYCDENFSNPIILYLISLQHLNLKNECVNLGFKIGTEGNGNCVLKLMELEKTANKKDVNSVDRDIVIQNSTNNDAVVEQMKRANEIEKNKVLLDISDKLLTRPQSSVRNCTTTVVGKLFNTRCN